MIAGCIVSYYVVSNTAFVVGDAKQIASRNVVYNNPFPYSTRIASVWFRWSFFFPQHNKRLVDYLDDYRFSLSINYQA